MFCFAFLPLGPLSPALLTPLCAVRPPSSKPVQCAVHTRNVICVYAHNIVIIFALIDSITHTHTLWSPQCLPNRSTDAFINSARSKATGPIRKRHRTKSDKLGGVSREARKKCAKRAVFDVVRRWGVPNVNHQTNTHTKQNKKSPIGRSASFFARG